MQIMQEQSSARKIQINNHKYKAPVAICHEITYIWTKPYKLGKIDSIIQERSVGGGIYRARYWFQSALTGFCFCKTCISYIHVGQKILASPIG